MNLYGLMLQCYIAGRYVYINIYSFEHKNQISYSILSKGHSHVRNLAFILPYLESDILLDLFKTVTALFKLFKLLINFS